MVLLENHDRRLQKALTTNTAAALHIKRAGCQMFGPSHVSSFLLRLDEPHLNVQYVGGYPAGIYWVNENLACIHGHTVRSRLNPKAVVDDERTSVILWAHP
ncbi:MAG: hypothetical protein CM15mV33_730 [uncultured marine virus]|nr:MAG: hypothetical protein CM15mV33_730 [uncultured marine virus]